MSLVARSLSVQRGRRCVVNTVDLLVSPGEFVALIGPNGAGKSSLLGALAGDVTVAAGSVLLDDKPLNRYLAPQLARRRAVLRQTTPPDLPFPVGEVVLMGRTPHRRRGSHAEDQAIAEAALACVGLAEWSGRLYSMLSGGEQQRVHLARVLAQVWTPALSGQPVDPQAESPGYLLLDEPTHSQDPAAAHLILTVARRFVDAGGGVLCVMHDLNLAALHADRLVLLCEGRVQAAGTPHEVLTLPNLDRAYGGALEVLPTERRHPLVIPRDPRKGQP